MTDAPDIHLNDAAADEVNDFLKQNHDACQGHRPQWPTILQRSLKHTPYLLTAHRDGQVVGYLPMMSVNSFLFGHHLVSMPYVNEAGVLSDEVSTSKALIDRALEINQELKTKRFELRHRHACDHPELIPTRTEKVASKLTLPMDEEALWKLPPAKARNLVKKARKFEIELHWGGLELLNAFYSVFSINMRDLGSPVYPKKMFRLILELMPDDAELCVLSYEGVAIAGALLIHDRVRGITEVPSASCLRSANHMCANMLMYYHLLLRSIEQGSRTFDFGRSTKDSGTHKFKKQWRADTHPTGWQTMTSDQPEQILKKEDNSKAVACWQKLPVSVATALGPYIVRGIP